MTPYERTVARLEGKTVDRIPNFCIIMTFAAKQCGIPYDKFISDYHLLVDGYINCCEKFGIDLLCAISDPMREAEGFGAKIIMPEDGIPYAIEPLIKEFVDISKLKVHKPESCRRMNDRIEAIRLFREKSNGYYPIAGWIEGAFAEACDLRGINNLMIDIIDEPDAVKELLEICIQQGIEFAKSQIKEGAHIIGIGDAAASLLGPSLYEKFALPYEKRLIQAIHDEGAKAKLHICGNIMPILHLINNTDADIVDCDWMVDFTKAVNKLSNSAVSGNFDPVAVLLQGTPTFVENAVRSCVDVASKTSLIAAGCEVPKDTPKDNLLSVSKALIKDIKNII